MCYSVLGLEQKMNEKETKIEDATRTRSDSVPLCSLRLMCTQCATVECDYSAARREVQEKKSFPKDKNTISHIVNFVFVFFSFENLQQRP